jgi:hypothetical protein
MDSRYLTANGSVACSPDPVPITPNDGANLATPVRALRATGAGNIKIVSLLGNTRTCAFAAGETRCIGAIKVFSTDTTATGIEGLV